MSAPRESLFELLTPPPLAGRPDEAGRARAWTATCLIAAPVSSGFAIFRWASGDPWLASLDLVGAACFVASAVYLQRTGDLRRAVDFTSIAGALLLVQALVLGAGLYAPAVAWYGIVPLTASLGLGRATGIKWSMVVVPLPLLALALDGGLPSAGGGPPGQMVSQSLFLAGIGAVAWSYETLTDEVRGQRDGALAALEAERQKTQDLVVSRTQFVKNVSHEFRTPLNHILGVTQLLNHTKLDDEQRDLVAMAERSGTSLLELIDGAIEAHDAEAGHITLQEGPLDLHVLLARLARQYAPRAQAKGLRFVLEIESGLPSRVIGDSKRIEQILDHILDNAVAFTHSGCIQLRAHVRGNGLFVFEVEDTGVGIDPGHVDRIFESFRQVDESDKRRHGGLGAGLGLCRRLARMMGGDVTVETTPGMGSTFAFTARLQMERRSEPASAEGEDFHLRIREARVLLAEPNPRTRRGFLGTLARMGLKADGAANQGELLERAGAFDIVFVDLDLPGSTSLAETVRRLRAASTSSNYLVALTRPERGEAVAIPPGFDDALPKPLRREQVLETLRRYASPGRDRLG